MFHPHMQQQRERSPAPAGEEAREAAAEAAEEVDAAFVARALAESARMRRETAQSERSRLENLESVAGEHGELGAQALREAMREHAAEALAPSATPDAPSAGVGEPPTHERDAAAVGALSLLELDYARTLAASRAPGQVEAADVALTAADVVYSVERITDPEFGSPQLGQFNKIDAQLAAKCCFC